MANESDDDYDFEEYKAKWNAARKNEFNFDDWCKEIDAHPAFMNKLPEEGEFSADVEALQVLKYDQDSSLEERAQAYKEDGNEHFAKKKYKEAILAYTEGIKLNCSDLELLANLYNNRSAAHYRLENFRSAFKDCLQARKLKPNYEKAFSRGLDCLMKLNCPHEALSWIEESKSTIETSAEIMEKKRNVERAAKLKDKERRKRKAEKLKTQANSKKLVEAFKERKIKFRNKIDLENFDANCLEVSLPQSHSCSVFLNDENKLVWPVLFLYPEYGTTDFIQMFDETSSFESHLEVLLSERPSWDQNGVYSIKTVEIYFESFISPDTLIRVPSVTTLQTALADSNYAIYKGLPSFLIISTKNEFYSTYLSRFTIKLLL